MTNEEEYTSRFKHIDCTKFDIDSVVWYAGDPYSEPGYTFYIRMLGIPTLMSLFVACKDFNPDWVIKNDQKTPSR